VVTTVCIGMISSCSAAPADPLTNAGRFGIDMALDPAIPATIGVILPPNRGSGPIRLVSIEPIDIRGAEILGIAMADPIDRSIVNAMGFPPAGWATQPVDGVVIHPDQEATVLIGVRIPRDTGEGIVEGIRVRYEFEGKPYESTLDWTLRFGPAHGSSDL